MEIEYGRIPEHEVARQMQVAGVSVVEYCKHPATLLAELNARVSVDGVEVPAQIDWRPDGPDLGECIGGFADA